jgi:hypothetical protein
MPKKPTPPKPPTADIPDKEKAILADIYRTFRRMYAKPKKGKKSARGQA